MKTKTSDVGEQRPRIAPREVRYAAVMKYADRYRKTGTTERQPSDGKDADGGKLSYVVNP